MAGEKQTRYSPDWKYEIPAELLGALDEYHILKVPLLGQHHPGGPSDWCGRTSCANAYNYYQVVQGGDFESRFITHSNGGNPTYAIDLRYPGGPRAFHKFPNESHEKHLSGYAVSGNIQTAAEVAVVQPPTDYTDINTLFASTRLGFSKDVVLPVTEPDRKAKAAQIANTPTLIESRLSKVLRALTSNNPVIFYSGFSEKKEEPIHLILIVGYAYLVDDTGRHLWLVVVDPSTHFGKITMGMFHTPTPKGASDVSAVAKKQLKGTHDFVEVIPGNWEQAAGALSLLRARKLFEDNPFSTVRDDLFMDYFSADHKGGTFIYSHKWTPVPPEFVYSSVARAVAFPFDGQQDCFRPVNCYTLTEQASGGLFPLGSQRNLHAGVHLESSRFTTQEPSPTAGTREVRSLASGYVVAVRLVGGIKKDAANETKAEGSNANTGADASKSTPEDKAAEAEKLAQKLAGNHNSFVLVRHDVEEVLAQKDGATPRRFTFYSLYMHLVPPDWKNEKTWQDVTWLKALTRKHGCVSVLDPAHEAFGQTRWLLKPPEGAATGKDEPLVPLKGGTLSTMGASPGTEQPLSLEGAEGDCIRAVWKKPDYDPAAVHEALTHGEIVTFRHPFLEVRAGELLGYIATKTPAPTAGDGFLHWEVLAPSEPGQLEAFLEYAEEKLGLGKGFFTFFEEPKGKQNNYFDPPASGEKGELDALLELAPRSKDAKAEDTEDFQALKDSYRADVLQRLLRSKQALKFSEVEAAPEDEPGYDVDVQVENYKAALPPGPWRLRFIFEPKCGEKVVDYDGKQASVRVRIPARARRIFVEPETAGSFFVQSGGGAGKDSLKKDVEHFKNLAAARWRRVVLRHTNEWSPDGIAQQLKARLQHRGALWLGDTLLKAEPAKLAEETIQSHANALAWWTSKKEKPFQGGQKQERFLFAEAPSDAEQLPEKTLLDHPHPVTFAWVLLLLSRYGFITSVDTPLWMSDEQKQTAAIAWLPAHETQPPRRVGESVTIAAVQGGNGGDKVAVRAAQQQWSVDLAAGTFTEGVFTQAVELPGWGAWRLESGDASVLGARELEGLAPVLQAAPEPAWNAGTQSAETPVGPIAKEDGTFSWRLPFRENCPRLLRGWVTLHKWVGGKEEPTPTDASAFEPAGLAIPAEAREDLSREQAGFLVADGYIQKGAIKDATTHLTQHFTYKSFQSAVKTAKGAAPAEPRLAWALVEAVERVQGEYSAKQLLQLSALSEDGLSVQLKGINAKSLRAAADKVKAAGWLADVQDADKGALRVSVPEPTAGSHPGELVLTFDPRSALSELRKSLPPEQRMAVRFGCIFPNGGGALDADLLPKDVTGPRHVTTLVEDLKSDAPGGYIALQSTQVSTELHHPAFAQPTWKLTASGVQFSVELLGAPESFWRAAQPSISLGQAALDKDAVSNILRNPLRVVRSVTFGEPKLKNKLLSVSASVKKKGVPFENEKLDVESSKAIPYDMKPRTTLEATPREGDASVLEVSIKTHAMAAGRAFKVELSDPRVTPTPKQPNAALLKVPKTCVAYKLPGKGNTFGMTDPEGVFRADVKVSDVAAALNGGRQYTLRVAPLAKEDKDRAREDTLTVPEELQPGEPEAPPPPRNRHEDSPAGLEVGAP